MTNASTACWPGSGQAEVGTDGPEAISRLTVTRPDTTAIECELKRIRSLGVAQFANDGQRP